jgi:hypothetical protein
MSTLLFFFSLSLPATDGPPLRLDGAFIQLDRQLASQKPTAWHRLLERMRDAELRVVIVQYVEARWGDRPATPVSFLPVRNGETDPVGIILEYSDAHPGMEVLLGLRYDARLFRSELLNSPGELRLALADELPRNLDLARRLADHYRLKERRSFAGWYLPLEVANYKEIVPVREDGWVVQVGRFTRQITARCKEIVDRPVTASLYFSANTENRPWLVQPREMGTMFARFLKEAGLSIIILQDGVGVARVETDSIESHVQPFLVEIERACKEASTPGRPIELWLNVESIGADVTRLKRQMSLGGNHAAKIVTFDFPNNLGKPLLYDDYLHYIRRRP